VYLKPISSFGTSQTSVVYIPDKKCPWSEAGGLEAVFLAFSIHARLMEPQQVAILQQKCIIVDRFET